MSASDTSHLTRFVRVPGNPEPEGADLIWFEGIAGRKLRACMAPPLREQARGTAVGLCAAMAARREDGRRTRRPCGIGRAIVNRNSNEAKIE